MLARTRWCEPSWAIHTVAGLALLAPGSSILTELAGMVPVILVVEIPSITSVPCAWRFVTPDSSCVTPAAGSSTREVDSSEIEPRLLQSSNSFTEMLSPCTRNGTPCSSL
ncbi:Uncharacterised protein [Mycobacterium tuberculosis]|nr:Uncharacterised protein [Mycobacterium tuberculosis]